MKYDLDNNTRKVLAAIARGDDVEIEYFRTQIGGDGSLWKTALTNVFYLIAKNHKLRLKPRTININGYQVPEPMRVAPAVGTKVYAASLIDRGDQSIIYEWDGDKIDLQWLKAGILHFTDENAKAHVKALISFTETK